MNKALLATLVAGAFATPVVFAQAVTPEQETVVAAQGATEAPSAQRPAQRQRAFAMPSQRVEARLAYLRTALKITDAQQPQWENFANVLRTQARAMDKRFAERRTQFEAQRGQPRPQANAIERLERMQVRMDERSQRLGEVVNAAKPLYASFSPEQRQIADEMLSRQGRGGHAGRGGFHHRGHHRG